MAMKEQTGKFKPMVGRLWELKNLTAVKQYPPMVMVIDEDNSNAYFMDELGNKIGVSKFYFRQQPVAISCYADEGTITDAISLLWELNLALVEATNEGVMPDKEKLALFRSKSEATSSKLREIANKQISTAIANTTRKNENEA